MASYITTKANTKLTANTGEAGPSCMKAAVARAVTNAECELGIPPEPISLPGSNDLVSIRLMIVFIICAAAQPITADISRSLASSSSMISLI